MPYHSGLTDSQATSVPTLAAIAPAFIAEICDALASDVGTMQTEQTKGLGASLAIQVASCVIERCTYDPSVNCGYIYVVRPRSAHYPTNGAPHSGTIAFLHLGFNIDVDVEGQLTGVELLDRSDIFLLLREARAL